MKKTFLLAIARSALFLSACTNNNNDSDTHTHEDGSTHGDHAHDTIKPPQQEFIVGDTLQKDSATKEHTHSDGEKHSH